jgi:AcrR family transcriptional regulator
MTTSRETEILQSAQKLIFRHGYSKVGMKDIADDCSISRPTLYKFFSNKEAIVARLIEKQMEHSLGSIQGLAESALTLRLKLEKFFDAWTVEPAAVAIDSVNGRDLMANVEKYAPQAVQSLYAEFERQLTKLLESKLSVEQNHLSANDLAHILTLATKGLKSSSSDLPELKRLIEGLISLTLAAVKL